MPETLLAHYVKDVLKFAAVTSLRFLMLNPVSQIINHLSERDEYF